MILFYVIEILLIWIGMFVFYRYRYKFCKQCKGKSSRICRNWMCKKTEECEFSTWPLCKAQKLPPEVCCKGICKKKSDCRFYIENWMKQNMVVDSEDDLEQLPDSYSVADKDK